MCTFSMASGDTLGALGKVTRITLMLSRLFCCSKRAKNGVNSGHYLETWQDNRNTSRACSYAAHSEMQARQPCRAVASLTALMIAIL